MVFGNYRPPEEDTKIFKSYCKDFLKKKSASSKTVFMVIFQNEFLPLIQRATWVTRTTAIPIDHIVTDIILESTMHSGIIKANISDHFPIFTTLENSCNKNKNYK